MPRGSKAKYSSKQKRMAEHIEEGYEDRGKSSKEAKRRAWATVNKYTGGGRKGGSGHEGGETSAGKAGVRARKSSSRGSSSSRTSTSKRKARGNSSSRSGTSRSTARSRGGRSRASASR